MARSPASVLSLTTIVERQTVEVDGTRYPLQPPDALPLFARLELEQKEQRLAALFSSATYTEAEQHELTDLLNQICRRILDAPAAVHDKLTDVHRMLIAEVFMKLPRVTRLQTEATALTGHRTPVHPSGANSSVGLPASTAGRRLSGSRRSRSGSSARAS